MSFLVDTNVFAAAMGENANAVVEKWLDANQAGLYTSSITIAEISFGIERLPLGRKRTRLQTGLDSLIDAMGERILRFDTRVALVWGKLRAELWDAGRLIPLEDSYIAAIALRHGLTVATRNMRDFSQAGIRTVNPFDG